MVKVDSVAKGVNLQNLQVKKQAQQNVSFKGNDETKATDGRMTKDLATAFKAIALAGMLAAGVTGCGKSEQPEQEFKTKNDVKTELRTSEFGKEVEKELLEKEFGKLISSTNAILDKKGMTIEEKREYLTKKLNDAIDLTSDIIFNGSEENIKENVKLAKEKAETVAKIMTDDKLSTTDKAKEFTKLFDDNNAHLLLYIGLIIAGIGGATHRWSGDIVGIFIAASLASTAMTNIKENNKRAEDILTGIMNKMEQRLSGENKEADQNWTILTEASSNNGSVTKK